MLLKNYQENAVRWLLSKTIKILNKNKNIWSLVFKSPTWSWKTIMMQEFLSRFADSKIWDFAFLWISVNDLANQSKKSFERNLWIWKFRFSELSDIEGKILQKNEILFINWEKINSTDKKTWEWKVLAMKENETGENLPNYLENTHKEWRKIILIVDESHRNLDTPKAQELIKNHIKPVLQIEVSATPDSKEIDEIEAVEIDDVIAEWMIKREVLINENFEKNFVENEETDRFIIKMAIQKRNDLLQKYEKIWSAVKPLILIQLPSEAQKTSELDKTKIERIINILKDDFDITFENNRLAIWLSDDKTNKDLIDLPESPVEVLIFKQAIATGWDCPRAQILVMFREMKTITFEIQTIGRILRMPEAKHYDEYSLDRAYIFTDLPKAEIAVAETAKNLIKNLIAERKDDIYKKFYLTSTFKSRWDYKDIWLSFYEVLAQTLLKKINWSADILQNLENIEKLEKFIDLENIENFNEILSDGKILVDIDNQTGEKIFVENTIRTKTENENIEIMFENFARNEVWPQFTNVSRSYKSIIESLYFALDKYFFKKKSRIFYQKMILKNKNFFIEILNTAKDTYIPQRELETRLKKQNAIKNTLWEIPKVLTFSEKSVLKNYSKNIMEPGFLSIDSQNEINFIEQFLEKSDLVDFWFKNGTISENYFWLPYENDFGEIEIFYPDFIVYFKNWVIWIFDPKSGFTLSDAKNKAKWLEKFAKENLKNGKKIIAWLIEIHTIWNTENFTIRINKTSHFNLKDRWDFDIFNDDFIKNYSFENLSIFDKNYKTDLEKSLNEKVLELENLEKNYKNFIDKQEEMWDFDFEKREELSEEIFILREKIKNLEEEMKRIF